MLGFLRKGLFFLILSMICTPSFSTVVDLFLIKNEKLAGDYNQLKGVERAITDTFTKNKIQVVSHEYPADQLNDLEKKISEKSSSIKIVLSVNDYGIEALKKLKKLFGDDIISVHLNHQQMTNHASLLKNDENKEGVDFIVLPTHAVDEKFLDLIENSKTKLIKTRGVCHNVHKKELNEEFEKIKKDIPGTDLEKTKYLVVILGGDTQNPDSTWRYYTESEAQSLAKFVSKKAKDGYFLLITNGPRTGKFDPETGKELKVHKEGIVDPVTQAFEKSLLESGLSGKNYKLYDFQFGKPSAWKGLLGYLVAFPGSNLIIEGGSTSMVSEALSNLPKETEITILAHGAMSDVHNLHMKSEYEGGHISILSSDMEFKARQDNKEGGEYVSAAQTVAGVLLSVVKFL